MERNGSRLRKLEGREVDVKLRDGRTFELCELVSRGRRRVPTLWLVVDGADVFVPTDAVVVLAASEPGSDHEAA